MKKFDYVSGDFTDPGLYQKVAEHLAGAKAPCFYLEIPPSLFATVAKGLGRGRPAGLPRPARGGEALRPRPRQRRRAGGRSTQYVTEPQLFRIDHYLGKGRCRTWSTCASPTRCSSRSGTASTSDQS